MKVPVSPADALSPTLGKPLYTSLDTDRGQVPRDARQWRSPIREVVQFGWGDCGGGTWTGLGVTIAGILLGAAVALLIPPLRDAVSDAVQGTTAQVRDDLGNSPGGDFLVVCLAMVHVIVWYPAA